MITTETYKILRAKLQPHLDAISKEMGITLSMGHGSFKSHEGSLKLHLNEVGVAGEKLASVSEWNTYAPLYGFSKDDLGKEFICGGNTYKITGWTSRRYKMPIDAVRSDGKKFKFPASTVKAMLPKKEVNLVQEKKVLDDFNEFNRTSPTVREQMESLLERKDG